MKKLLPLSFIFLVVLAASAQEYAPNLPWRDFSEQKDHHVVISVRIAYMQDEIFGSGTDPYLRSPNSEAGTYVVSGISAGVMPPRFLIHCISVPGKRPYLPSVGMAAELEIDTRAFRFLQVERLVVQQDREPPGRNSHILESRP